MFTHKHADERTGYMHEILRPSINPLIGRELRMREGERIPNMQ
jgi:hypothetical protein